MTGRVLLLAVLVVAWTEAFVAGDQRRYRFAPGVTRTAATCALADVEAKVTASSDGDTVEIPSGTCAWTSVLTIAKAITLRGSGVGNTIIQDNSSTDSAIVQWTLVSGRNSRMTGIEFQNLRASGVDNLNFNGVVSVSGANTDGRRIRIDHCEFDSLRGANIFTQDTLGVIDNNTFINPYLSVGGGGNSIAIALYVYHENWDGVTNSDASWSEPPALGTEEFLFFEDNTVTLGAGGDASYAITDAYRGARYVVRYNTITNGWVEAHGSDSGGRKRGTRAVEIYENDFICTVTFCSYIANFRSGTGVIYNNTTTNYFGLGLITLSSYRLFMPFSPFDQADGDSTYDVNDGGSPFTSGTANGGSSSTMTVAGTPWVADEHIGRSVRKTSACASPSTNQCASIITANTNNTLTFHGTGGYAGTALSWTNGETYVINKVTEALDQPGRGQGTQMTGAVPVWTNDQVDEPLYEWNNPTSGGGDIAFNIAFPSQIRATEHYVTNTAKPGYTAYAYPHPLRGGS